MKFQTTNNKKQINSKYQLSNYRNSFEYCDFGH